MHVTFYGATETVTGSRFAVEARDRRVLVDCGLYQGLKHLRARNWAEFPTRPAGIDSVVLTHAHIDHSGYLPRLVRNGFDGPIHCTEATAALLEILLPDAAKIQEEDAARAAHRGSSRHQPPLPLYTVDDAQAALALVRRHAFEVPVELGSGVTARFSPVGHILGAATVTITDGARTIGFTGDVGRPDDPLVREPAPMQPCDLLVCESTYGDRRHPDTDPADELGELVRAAIGRGGSVVIPSFAVGRAQTLLHLLARLRRGGQLPDVPVFLDSPMAVTATEILVTHPDEHRLTVEQVRQMFDGVELVRTPDESKAIAERHGPSIIVAASGMATGGRVLHHLARLAPDPRTLVLFAGYQAAGTRGDSMVKGAGEIKVFGEYVPVRAEVRMLDGLSAHADCRELCDWLERSAIRPSRAMVVHGEPSSADAMRRLLHDRLGFRSEVAQFKQSMPV